MRNSGVSRRMRSLVALVLAAATVPSLAGCTRIAGTLISAGSEAASGPSTNPVVPSDVQSPVLLPKAGVVQPPVTGAYLGVYSPPAPFVLDQIARFEHKAGREASIVMWYQPWAPGNRYLFDSAACLAVMRRGAVPMITWEPWNPGANANFLQRPADQPSFRLSEIIAGRYDDYIADWAWAIRRLGGPVMLRPMHEMNGRWYPWSGAANGNSPQQFVQAWRHIHDIFVAKGATNVAWVWSVNAESVPNTPANSWAAYYPGDAYVDWTAVSGFNWGTAGQDTKWTTFSQLYTPAIAYLSSLGKPICVSEMGSVDQGGDKAAWIEDAYRRIQDTPDVKAVVYFDSLEQGPKYKQDWRIDSTPGSLEAFRKAIDPDYFVGTPPTALANWSRTLGPTDWTYLSSFEPVY